MRAIFVMAGLLILAGCAGASHATQETACSTDPGGRDCQVERYLNAP